MLKVVDYNKDSVSVLDTDDGIVEVVPRDVIMECLSRGMDIEGICGGSTEEFARKLVVGSIWRSANLEGFSISFSETEAILKRAVGGTDKELFVLNMDQAWQFLLETYDMPLNLAYMRQLNKICGDRLFYGNGSVRTTNVSMGGTSWVPDIPVTSVIIDDLEEYNKISDAELRALKLFCYVARSQIFIDGNKRVAQLVANKVLIEANVGVFQIDVKDLVKFRSLLVRYYETNNDTEIIGFMRRNCVKKLVRTY